MRRLSPALLLLGMVATATAAPPPPAGAPAGDAPDTTAAIDPDLAREIAYQKLWREEAEQSISYFKSYLADHPGEDHREVRQGLALAYSWSGRQREAVALYGALAVEDPADGSARVGLGRSLIWDNRLHDGFAILRAVEDEHPAADEAGRESRSFLLTVLDEYTPHLETRLTASWDSDDLEIYRLGATGTTTVLGNNLLQVLPAHAWYRQPGQPDVRGLRLGGGLVAPLARNWSLHAYAWQDRFRSDVPLFAGPAALAWNRAGGDAWLTWLPASRWRVDAGASSQPVETYYALQNHIGLRQANLSLDRRLARRWSLGLGGNLGDYSDGNRSRRGTARLTWRHEGRWEVQLGPVLTYLDYLIPYPGGYWAPDWVRNGSLEAALKTRGRGFTLRLSGSLGLEKETGNDAVTVGGAAARLGWRLAPGWLAAIEAGHSHSSFSSAGGYNRTSAGLYLRAIF